MPRAFHLSVSVLGIDALLTTSTKASSMRMASLQKPFATCHVSATSLSEIYHPFTSGAIWITCRLPVFVAGTSVETPCFTLAIWHFRLTKGHCAANNLSRM